MTTLQRLALLGKDVLFSSRIMPASQQLSSLRSFNLEGLASAPSSQWAWSEALGVQRILSLIPSLADVQLWAVPKRKVGNLKLWAGVLQILYHLGFMIFLLNCIKTQNLVVFLLFFWKIFPAPQVTPHRKGKRSANKHIRFIPTVSRCSKCDKVFPQHAMPSKCEEDECPAFNLRERPGSSKPAAAAVEEAEQ